MAAQTSENKVLATSGTEFLPEQVDVLLVSMPFGPLLQPSIGLGLLKAAVDAAVVNSSEILYFTLDFAKRIGVTNYLRISNGQPATFDLMGEWLFAEALFGSSKQGDIESYFSEVAYGGAPHHRKALDDNERVLLRDFIGKIPAVRAQIEEFLDECLHTICARHPHIVVFTSVFQQHVAALALARKLKAIHPDVYTIIGGANCEGVMGAETVRQFPFIDAAISGEGDIVFPEVIRSLLDERVVPKLTGVYTQSQVSSSFQNAPWPNAESVTQMDFLPYPDYEDFFEQLGKSGLLEAGCVPRLLFESSRGCWWGQKSHCTFCGLNGSTISYRSKSADRALNELLYLSGKYPGCQISVVDNILDMKYFRDFIPELASRGLNLELFYEVKANLKKDQVRLLNQAGIKEIQPGIESLSTRVLKLMKKGVSELQNIQLLKWCKELGVTPAWNVLWGFPGELPEDYARMSKLAPLLTHLEPPRSASSIRLDRFSPHFDVPDQFGFTNVQPYPSYSYIYPFAPDVVANLAYYFTFDYVRSQDVLNYTEPLAEQIRIWNAVHPNSDLFSIDKGSHLLIWDLRPIARSLLHVLVGVQRLLYIACDEMRTSSQLQEQLSKNISHPPSLCHINDQLESLKADGLLITDEDWHLSLAIPVGEYSPSRRVLERFVHLLEQSSESQDPDVFLIPAGR